MTAAEPTYAENVWAALRLVPGLLAEAVLPALAVTGVVFLAVAACGLWAERPGGDRVE
jgi:hypothetical protein